MDGNLDEVKQQVKLQNFSVNASLKGMRDDDEVFFDKWEKRFILLKKSLKAKNIWIL